MIICAAIKLKLDKEYVVPYYRHSDGYAMLLELTGISKLDLYPKCEDGFINHNNEFLNRTDAWEHAVECGQMSYNAKLIANNGVLFSEDLY